MATRNQAQLTQLHGAKHCFLSTRFSWCPRRKSRPISAPMRYLAAVVPSVCAKARKDFGDNAELVLSVYHDPEIDDHYLELNVRLPVYNNDFAAQFDRISEPFDAELGRASGYFLVTTDLRKAHAKHAI